MDAKTPANVPAENVYNGMHWTIPVALLAAIAAVVLVVHSGSTLFSF